MTERINLKELERKAYLSYHQDGLLDLFLGTALLSMSLFMLLAPLLGEEYIFLPVSSGMFVAWIVSYAGVKRVVTVPRIGYVEFSTRRQRKLTAIYFCFATSGLVLGLVLALDMPLALVVMPILVSNGLLLIGLGVGGIFAVLGLASGIRRSYGYGGLALVAFALSHFFAVAVVWPTVALGVATTVNGAILLVRFVHKYPKEQAGEVGNARPREE